MNFAIVVTQVVDGQRTNNTVVIAVEDERNASTAHDMAVAKAWKGLGWEDVDVDAIEEVKE